MTPLERLNRAQTRKDRWQDLKGYLPLIILCIAATAITSAIMPLLINAWLLSGTTP